MKRGNTPRTPASPDMTPMMDIVFILIIFFVVTASFEKELGIELGRPDGSVPHEPEQDVSLVFELGPEGTVLRHGVLTDVWSAAATMKQFRIEHTDKPVILKLREGSQVAMLIRLYDLARAAGYGSADIQVV